MKGKNIKLQVTFIDKRNIEEIMKFDVYLNQFHPFLSIDLLFQFSQKDNRQLKGKLKTIFTNFLQ